MHPSSTNFSTRAYNNCPYLVYHQIVHTTKPYVRDSTALTRCVCVLDVCVLCVSQPRTATHCCYLAAASTSTRRAASSPSTSGCGSERRHASLCWLGAYAVCASCVLVSCCAQVVAACAGSPAAGEDRATNTRHQLVAARWRCYSLAKR
jgi:hypothetical protein